jgi:hypothetical protein
MEASLQKESVLTVKIENNNPVELNQLAMSLSALGLQYDSFLRKYDNCNYTKTDRKLYISKLNQGSIIIELAPFIIPLIQDVNTVACFLCYLKESFNLFLGKETKIKYNHSKQDLEQLHTVLNLTAKDTGSNLYVEGNLINNFSINHMEANAIQNYIARELNNKEQERPEIFKKELMYWANASFVCSRNRISDKVVIEKIDKRPKNVIFLNDEDAVVAKNHNEKFPGKNWQDLAYVVDVEVSYIEDIPKGYKILKLYKEEIFDPEN